MLAGRLLAVKAEKKGHVFPSWQFAENGLLPGVEEVLDELKNLSPWTQLQFFLNADLRLDGEIALEELRKSKVPTFSARPGYGNGTMLPRNGRARPHTTQSARVLPSASYRCIFTRAVASEFIGWGWTRFSLAPAATIASTRRAASLAYSTSRKTCSAPSIETAA